MMNTRSENPRMKWHKGLRNSNTVSHPPMSLGRRYFREQLKKAIKDKNKESR